MASGRSGQVVSAVSLLCIRVKAKWASDFKSHSSSSRAPWRSFHAVSIPFSFTPVSVVNISGSNHFRIPRILWLLVFSAPNVTYCPWPTPTHGHLPYARTAQLCLFSLLILALSREDIWKTGCRKTREITHTRTHMVTFEINLNHVLEASS